MALHGVAIVRMFAPMHECAHRTAFASRLANDLVGWIAGVLSICNSTERRALSGTKGSPRARPRARDG
jgi:fatty acid desaturase